MELMKAYFEIGLQKDIAGVFDSRSRSKKFTCWSPDLINIDPHSNIFGKTSDNKKLSLINCLGSITTHSSPDSRMYESEIYSHTIIVGNEYLAPEESNIESISFKVGNPLKLFRYQESFGYLDSLNPNLINALNEENDSPDFIIENNPIIAYFNGETELFSQNTKLGNISASNNIRPGLYGTPNGVGIENEIIITINFPSKVKLQEALERANITSKFLRFIGGDGLYFERLSLMKVGVSTSLTILYDSYEWGSKVGDSKDSTPFINLSSKNFGQIIEAYFNKEDRNIVRNNFYSTYFSSIYSSSRLITAANMFDIFPFGHNKNKCLKDRIFSRLRKLKDKINDDTFTQLETIVPYAITARKYFVHGKLSDKLTPEDLYKFLATFIQVLEYIYAMSELLECGWDPKYDPIVCYQHKINVIERDIDYLYSELISVISKNLDSTSNA